MNPPICAQNAMPVAVFESIRDVVPLSNCPTNQMPMYMMAGMGRKKGMIKMGMKEMVVLFGNMTI